MEKLKVLVLDNETLTRIGLKYIIKFFWLEMTFLPEDIVNKESKEPEEMPDLIILGDTFKSKSTGIKKLKFLRREFPSSKILIFSAQGDGIFAIPYLYNGAQGCISKNAGVAKIINAIEIVLEGERLYCSVEVKRKIISDLINGKVTMKRGNMILSKKGNTTIVK